MNNNFNTGKEVEQWRNFRYNNQYYDLSHLNEHWAEYLDDKDENNPILYKFIVTYGLHRFTKESNELSSDESQLLMYHAPNESRQFNFDRYELSKQLPSIIKSLSKKTTLVCHAGNGNYATVKVLDSNGIEVDYYVVLVFKKPKKLRLHIVSAYPRYEGIGKIRKVGFFIIAKNLLNNRKLPS
ncbi:MAG: heat-shock protein [Nostoc sp.]